MHASPRYLSCLFAIILFVCFWGCSGDDEPGIGDPGGGNPGGTQFSDDPALQAQIDKGLEIGNAMMTMMPQWASGNFVGPPDKDAIFNESCTCWAWQQTLGSQFGNPFDYTMWDFTATFYAGETAVADPEDADRVVVEVSFVQNSGFFDAQQEDGDNESTTFTAFFSVSISPVGGDPVTISGGGTADFSSSGTIRGTYFAYFSTFGVDMNLTLPLTGCPSGEMQLVDMGREDGVTSFSISYDGTTTAWWTLSIDGTGEFRGSETLICGGK